MSFKYGDETQYAQDQLFSFDVDDTDFDDSLPGAEYMEELDELTLFSDGIKERIRTLEGYLCPEDDKQMLVLLLSYCKMAGISISRQTLENWLTKSAPNGNSRSRENVYRLCFALQMNHEQTREFFLKCYLERPFNYKDIHEAVYYYCLRVGKTFQDAERLIRTVEDAHFQEGDSVEIATEQIGRQIEQIVDEDELVDFLIQNKALLAQQNTTATKKIEYLIAACMPLAEQEYNLYADPDAKKKTVNSVDDLLLVIYNFAARRKVNRQRELRSSIKNSDFPKLIKRNFPERQEIENIIKGRASFDVIRKALIMLNFYYFFVSARLNKADAANLFDEFTEEMDLLLMECGYVQLYWRNPYDWMIGYCAFSDDPLETLRALIDEYYLSRTE